MRALDPDELGSTPMPGAKWSKVLLTASIGTRSGAVQVAPSVEVDRTMSLLVQLARNEQSDHATYTRPALSISAEGSGLSRRLSLGRTPFAAPSRPDTSWCWTVAIFALADQLVPPSVELKARSWSTSTD